MRVEHMTLAEFSTAVAAPTPAPGGGAVAAVAGSLAASLTGMVAQLALRKVAPGGHPELTSLAEAADHLRHRLLALADEDRAAFEGVLIARRSGDQPALVAAWRKVSRVPAEVVRLCREAAQLAHRAARDGPESALGDAVMAALLAAAAAAGSQVNLRLNVQAAGRPADLLVLVDGSGVDLREAQRAAADTRLLAEERLTGKK